MGPQIQECSPGSQDPLDRPPLPANTAQMNSLLMGEAKMENTWVTGPLLGIRGPPETELFISTFSYSAVFDLMIRCIYKHRHQPQF